MLNISGLTKTYPNGVKALNGINLSIPKGMFGLLGPNGAGKSSLMRTIATLQTPDTGTIQFDDIDVLADPNGLRQRLGYLPQDFGVYPRISAEKLLDHLAVLKGINNSSERKDAVESLLVHTNLWQHRDKAVSGYSGGMRQRFGIAQALLADPDPIIVDEPTAGLDPEERNRFHNLLVSLGEEKVIILSTHIVDDVSELCPKMAVLGQGKILLEGNPISLTHELTGRIWRKQVSQDEYRELQQHLNIISARLIAGKHVIHVMADTSPEGFEQAPANLEDVYFSTLHNSRAATAA